MIFNFQNKKIQGIISILIAAIVFMSYSDNPPNGKTGAPGDGLCTDCHNSDNPGNFDGGIEITGFPASITPNTVYPLIVKVSNPNGFASKAGFQFTILNASNQKFGTFILPSASCTISMQNNRDYVEHNPAQLFNGMDEAIWTVNWISPATGSAQTIKIYAAANIANNNDNDDGDWITTAQFSGIFAPLPDPLTVTVAGTNVNCFGNTSGSATAIPAGGIAPYSYSWSNGGNTATISNLAAGLYTVTVTDGTPSTTVGSYTVTQPSSALSVDVTAPGTVIDCNNLSIALSGVASGGTSSYTYLWSNGSITQDITVFDPDSYTLTVTANKGCLKSDAITITEVDPPIVTLNAVPQQCEFDPPVTLVGSPVGGFYSGPGVTGNTFNPSVAGPGQHVVTYIYTSMGCTVSDDINITVINVADVTINNIGTICINEGPFTLSANIGGGFWSGDGVIGNQIFPEQAGLGNHIVTYTVSVNGCTTEASSNYNVVDAAVVEATIVPDLCTTDPVVALQGLPAGGTWTGTGVSNNSFNPGTSGAGTFTLTYSFTNNAGCISSTTITVNVSPCGCTNPASANAGTDQSVCNFNSVMLAGGANSTPMWSTSGDGTFANPNNVVTQYNWGTNDKIAKTVTLTLTAGDPDGNGPCTAFSDQMVVTNNSFEVVINELDAQCTDGDAIDLSATPAGGTWTGQGVLGSQFNPSTLPIGFYVVHYSTTNLSGCTDEDSIVIQVKNCACALDAHLVASNQGCQGDSTGTLTVAFDVAGTEPYSYEWSDGSNEDSLDSLSVGTYTVTVTDANNCSVVIQGSIVNEVVTVHLSYIRANCDEVICIDSLTGAAPYVFLWSTGGTNACIDVSEAPVGVYSVMVTNSNGCSGMGSIPYTPIPELSIEVDSITVKTDLNDGVINITATGGIAPYTFNWEKNGLFFSTEEDLDSLSLGSYTLTVTDSGGCASEFGPYLISTTVATHKVDALANSVKIFPIPTDRYFYLESKKDIKLTSMIVAVSMNGEQTSLNADISGNNKFRVDTDGLNAGVYMIRISSNDAIAYKKLVIVK